MILLSVSDLNETVKPTSFHDIQLSIEAFFMPRGKVRYKI